MANENSWGAPRIHAELCKLGFEVAERTVSRYMPRRPAAGDVVKRWKAFLRNHCTAIAAMDFFTIPTATFRVLYVFFVVHHARRVILHFAVTTYPTAAWVVQQLRLRVVKGAQLVVPLRLEHVDHEPVTWIGLHEAAA
ncbi:MAG: integrase, partial [Deltaproteobacteria bacterium]|nr:integrase [Deltaproteobacteria bacterium]